MQIGDYVVVLVDEYKGQKGFVISTNTSSSDIYPVLVLLQNYDCKMYGTGQVKLVLNDNVLYRNISCN